MHIRQDGRVALVTGAAQGIGQAIARGLKEEGAQVHVADLDAAGVNAFAQQNGFTPHVLDVSDRKAAAGVVDAIAARAGRLDILVNAAGGVRGQVGRPIEEVSEDDWRVIFRANVDGAFFLAQAAAAPMRQAKFGRIVNIASGAGLAAEPHRHPGLHVGEARAGRADQAALAGPRAARHHLQCGRARVRALESFDASASGRATAPTGRSG